MIRSSNTEKNNSNVLPISDLEFDALLTSSLIQGIDHIAVGVSGGPDSLALTLLLKRWCSTFDVKLTALTVDHRLRPNSAMEIEKVSTWLQTWDVKHEVLLWNGLKPATGIQELARQARYDLMLAWCLENDAPNLFLAHHQEDQAETFLMRLISGSGVDGLACMSMVFSRKGVRLIRPLLNIPKVRLRATLEVADQEWIDDPSNKDLAFTRTKIRKLLDDLKTRNIGPARLASLVGKFRQLRWCTEEVTRLAINRGVIIHDTGWANVETKIIKRLPNAILRRVIIFLLKTIGGSPYPPRSKKLDRVINLIVSEENFTAFSLGGCVVRSLGKHLTFFREEYKSSPSLIVNSEGCILWRGVFECKFSKFLDDGSSKHFLAPLGQKGWEKLVKEKTNVELNWIPYKAALTLPALFDCLGVLEVPHFNYRRTTDLITTSPKFNSARFVPLDQR